jgi:KDO2-lipid IV(A) lauroyltransferase
MEVHVVQSSKSARATTRSSQFLKWLVYIAIRVTVCILQAMPLELCYSFARLLGQLGYRLDKRHRTIALDNLRHAFPNRYSDSELLELVQRVYLHFSMLVVEIAHIPRRLRPTTWRDMIEVRNQEPLVEKVVSGRPVILLTAHFGNWEMAGYTMAVFGFKPHSVARALDNPYVERLLRTFRTRTGQEIIYKRGAFDQVADIMRKGAMIGMLSDQDAGHRGVFVEFFGRPASSHKGVALLALEHDAPICVGFARRLGDKFKFEVWMERILEPRDYVHLPDPVRSITQECARAFESAIRANPEQYLWLHRRWKHQPGQGHESKAA